MGEEQGTQAMHLPGQKQRRTTDAATMQEKETLVAQAKKCIPTPTTRWRKKLGQSRAKSQPRGLPAEVQEVQKRSLGGEGSVSPAERKLLLISNLSIIMDKWWLNGF